jgi:group I intron endonuclease
MKKFNYVYLTTNLLDKKQYVGDHSCDNFEKDNYLGSGLYLKRAINEYGKENFKKEILEFFPTKQEAFDAQEKYINEYNTLVPNGYNLSPKGGHNCYNCFSEESKEKIRKSRIGKPSPMKGKHHTKNSKNKTSISMVGKNKGKPSPMKGRAMPQETKEKIRNKLKGIKLPPETCKKMRDAKRKTII